ncbi:MAG: aspartate kinase [Acidibacillus sp.]|nr:aspartate kinase [Acidibacillus sp.]
MKVIVQKFGGTSVSSRSMREKAVMHIEAALEEGYSVVVVVSAMGRIGEPYATDTLLSLVRADDTVSARDMDLLMSCGETISAVIFGSMLRGRGHEVTVLTGAQAGMITSNEFGNARIAKIDPERIVKELKNNRIVVVTGFQGMTHDGETTTLGRGGSDTSATALGVALDAEFIDIFTDVDGIMTADPNIVEGARRLSHLTYTEIANFASQGAKVIHPRAVELAMQKNIPIRVRSTESNDLGTLVTSGMHFLEARPANDKILTGVAHSSRLTQIKVRAKTKRPGFQNLVFRSMAENDISVDFFNVTPEEVVYTVPNNHVSQAVNTLLALDLEVETIANVAKVAAVGAGIHGVPGVMARIVEALTDQDIEILQSADSNTTIWCLVHEADMANALRAIHDKFNL